jgi:hypothetical protein
MAMRKLQAIFLAAVMAAGAAPSFAQQSNGTISGIADDEANRPYSNYSVQLRDAATGQVVSTTNLTDQGRFTFENVGLSRRLLVELVNLKDKDIVCTEGPFTLTPQGTMRTDVNIDCGKVPAAFWLLAAGAGTAAAIALADESPSQ